MAVNTSLRLTRRKFGCKGTHTQTIFRYIFEYGSEVDKESIGETWHKQTSYLPAMSPVEATTTFLLSIVGLLIQELRYFIGGLSNTDSTRTSLSIHARALPLCFVQNGDEIIHQNKMDI